VFFRTDVFRLNNLLDDIIGSLGTERTFALEFRGTERTFALEFLVINRATERLTDFAATFVRLLIFSFAIFLRSASKNLIRALFCLPGRCGRMDVVL